MNKVTVVILIVTTTIMIMATSRSRCTIMNIRTHIVIAITAKLNAATPMGRNIHLSLIAPSRTRVEVAL